ncbi:MAG: carbohydrate kinase family protein [Chloroflexota bacterium]
MFASVGITTVDLFNSGIDQMPEFGGNEFTVNNLAFCENPLQFALGGNGAITAFALARLGVPTILCSAVGDDPLGKMAAGWLSEAGVETSRLLQSTDGATATTTVMTDAGLNRVSFHHPGASTIYGPADFPISLMPKLEMLLLSSYTLLPQWRPEGFVQIAQQARSSNVPTLLDVGPAIGQVARLEEMEDLLPAIDYFICNDHEINVCTGQDELYPAMQAVLSAGAGCVITKQGEQGASILQPGQHEPEPISGFAVNAHFTVGAGDSFNAGFMLAIHQQKGIQEAVRFANAVAGLVVSAAQGSLGAPTLEETEQFLEQIR